jgi:hypothetical protein
VDRMVHGRGLTPPSYESDSARLTRSRNTPDGYNDSVQCSRPLTALACVLFVTACDFGGSAERKGTSSAPTGEEAADFIFGAELAAARKAIVAEGPNARLESFACIDNAAPAVPVNANELFCFGRLRPGGCAAWAVRQTGPIPDVRRLRRSASFGFGCVSNRP